MIQDDAEMSVSDLFSNLNVLDDDEHQSRNILICDCGYGFPREKKPRREKINAIVRQLVNFLEWQVEKLKKNPVKNAAQIHVIGCSDETVKSVLVDRTIILLNAKELPSHVVFSCKSLEEFCASSKETRNIGEMIYLSPDSNDSIDPCKVPASVVIVGMLIDRRVQPNRSKERASDLNILSQRWPLDQCFAKIDPNEPLNVDCILEGMQQWWWNCEENVSKEAFVQAASQAIEHHAQRHPSRPVHLPVDNS